MSVREAKIKITNLRLRTYIGFNDEERQKQQDVVINVVIHYPADKAALSDQVKDAVNYKTVTKRIIQQVEEGRFMLLEKLVSDVLDISSEHSSVSYASVTIDKPHALRFADSVSLTMDLHKE
ncbi:dihydroneopterin triphosphate 2'-epimerase [Maricurvus nonylphenolicus]|uniref:dihydroneopterin triphosphate 2'-epimerase n=1 Tax=Maricurvus nonylphenolicus TaxID=1008307 RepID=UPI0036F31B52